MQVTHPIERLFPKLSSPLIQTVTSIGLIGFSFLGAGGDQIINNISKNITIIGSGLCLGLVSSSVGTGTPAQKEYNLKNTALVFRDTLYIFYAISPYLNEKQQIPTFMFIGLGISSFLCVSADLTSQYYQNNNSKDSLNNLKEPLTSSSNNATHQKSKVKTLSIIVASNLSGSLAFYAYYYKKNQLASIFYILNGSVFLINIANQLNNKNQQANIQPPRFITYPNILKTLCHTVLNIAYILIKPHPKNKLATIAEISQAHLLSFQLCFNLYQSSEKNNLNNDIQNRF